MKNLTVRTQKFRGLFAKLVAIGSFAALLTAAPIQVALAATAPPLGTAQTFAVVAGDTVTNTGPSVVTGDLGISPGSALTGFLPGVVTGATELGNAVSLQAKSDARTAYNNLASQACDTTYVVPTDLGGMTLVPGVYCFASSAGLTGTVPLTLSGTASDVWVFKTVSTLITGAGSSVVMSGGAQDCNVFWQVGSSATLGANTSFIGNILAFTSISLGNGANVSGRALAGLAPGGGGAVTMDTNLITPAACSTAVPPTLIKAFSPNSITAGGTSTLTIILSNSNSSPATFASFTDTLPAGVTFVGINTAVNTCGATISNTTGAVTLGAGSIPASGFCTVTATVTSSVVGPHVNSTDSLVTNQGTAPPASDTLTVLTPGSIPPTLSKAFSPANINGGDNSTLTITLGNTNTTAATFATFTDTLPIGVTFVGLASTTCTVGSITNDANTVTLTNGSIPTGGCTVTATVTSSVPGLHLNTTGALVTDKGTAPPASDNLIVNAITIVKSFTPNTIGPGGVSLLTITVTNPNTSIAPPVAFVDFLPSSPGQMLVAAGPQTNTCGGTLTAIVGSSSVTLAGGLLPIGPSSCTVTVYVTAPTLGDYTNKLGTAVAILHVIPCPCPTCQCQCECVTCPCPAPVAPTLSKSFSPSIINTGGVSILTITLSNSSSTVATMTAPLTDTLPSGLVIAQTPSASSTCGGTLMANAGGSKVILTGGSIPANGSCKVTVGVTAKNVGGYSNKLPAGALQTNIGSNATLALAILTVLPNSVWW